jgi:hypothetical protein
MIGYRVAAFGCPRSRRSLTGNGDLIEAKARLVADHGPGAPLALQAVAQSDARWLALDREVKLPAATGGTTGHLFGSGITLWSGRCRSLNVRDRLSDQSRS